MTIEQLGSLGEIIGAAATVATLLYLAIQIRQSNRLARAEASRLPNSDLNSINGAFGTDRAFLSAFRKVLGGATRPSIDDADRTALDFYFVSVTNIQDQLVREVREGVVDVAALDFGGAGLFALPYYQSSWPIYRNYLSSAFVEDFEKRYQLDASIEAIL